MRNRKPTASICLAVVFSIENKLSVTGHCSIGLLCFEQEIIPQLLKQTISVMMTLDFSTHILLILVFNYKLI